MPDSDRLFSPEAKADIQGFITSGRAHLPHAAYLFVRIEDRTQGRGWIAEILPSITDSSSWRKKPGEPKVKPQEAANVAFTYRGLEALGFSEQTLCVFPDELREGMAESQRARILGDTEESAPEAWELGGPNNPEIHALLLLESTTSDQLDDFIERQHTLLAATAGGVVEIESAFQRGGRLPGGREPFGFRDGLGQPRIEGIKGSGVRSGEFVLGYENHYNFVPPGPVVRPEEDPGGVLPASANPYHRQRGLKDLGRHGTYLVYRKLRQDVAGFWRFLRRQSVKDTGAPDPRHMIWLASKMVGRWPSGAPLVLAPEGDDPKIKSKDRFSYAEQDPDGLRCPFGSHVRRSNPRDMIRPTQRKQSLSVSDAHRLLRRASTFGGPLFDFEILEDLDNAEKLQRLLEVEDDGEPRGIHFFSVNANIKGQFEFVQQTWCNNPRFNGLTDNRDPLIGDNGQEGKPSYMTIPERPFRRRTAALPRFVTVKGGGYFFLPSLTALRYLAG